METPPKELSLQEIRKFMLLNNCKVTNHALVKHFRPFLTNKDTQDEARRQFKTYVNLLASIKHEGSEKYLVLRRKFYEEIPSDDSVPALGSQPMSPASRSFGFVPSDGEASPMRQPPPYRPPPVVSPDAVSYQGSPRGSIALNRRNSSDYIHSGSEVSFGSEFASVDGRKLNPLLARSNSHDIRQLSESARKQSVEMLPNDDAAPPAIPPRKRVSESGSAGSVINSRQNSVEEKVLTAGECPEENKENEATIEPEEKGVVASEENKLSVKEKMMKFNRLASEEEAKIPSPIGKKKPDKNAEETINAENLLQHPNAKEWLIAAAKSDYQLLAKLSTEHPTLVKLQDISMTALHWAAKHGSEDVVKLVAGKLKADVNARTNGGYTALHIATQFGKNDIFELLCNVYKADRDLLDWSGKKALEYQKQMMSVSASTHSKIKARKKHSEKDSGFLRIGSLNVRVKKTTEAFSNFLGVGTHQTRMPPTTTLRNSVPVDANFIDKLHKNWGSADNIQQEDTAMPPPKYGGVKKRRQKRDIEFDPNNDHFSQSVPTTPSQVRAPVGALSENPDGESMGDSDSDTACGFDSNWRPTYI